MTSRYELILTDERGKRITLLNKTDEGAAFFSYSRVINGFGTVQIGLPYRQFKERVHPVFEPDRRIEVWRSPDDDHPLRLEGIYLLRQPKIYTREEDAVDIIEFFGRSPLDLLARRWIIQAAGTSYTAKTAAIDDMMKAIVREQMLWLNSVDKNGAQDNTRAYPDLEFSVQADYGLGTTISRRFADRNVLDVLKELMDTSFQLFDDDPANNRKIYFDLVPRDLRGFEIYIQDEETGQPIQDEDGLPLLDEQSGSMNAIGFQFQTFADLRGVDRTEQLLFSVANSNLKGPFYSKNHFEEKNSIIVKGSGRGESREIVVVNDAARVNSSRWNRCETIFEANYEVDDTELQNVGAAQLKEGKPVEELFATFLNLPGNESVPSSLYGIDWDLGDLVPVWYAEQLFRCEIVVVYVGVDQNGVETITGRNTIGAAE
jgi:hypothetical protein